MNADLCMCVRDFPCDFCVICDVYSIYLDREIWIHHFDFSEVFAISYPLTFIFFLTLFEGLGQRIVTPCAACC